MKLAEIRAGEHYAVRLNRQTRYQDADVEAKYLGEVELPGAWNLPAYSRVRVLAVGVPFGKTLQGVRIEYAYTDRGVAFCSTCGNYGPGEDVDRTNEVTIHARAVVAQWDDHLMDRELRRAGWDSRIRALMDRRIEEEIRNLLDGGP
jgi:hypothetical protein